MKKKSKNCDLVLIEWEDSRQPTSEWVRLAGFKSAGICKCASVGFLIHDGVNKKVLASNMADIEDKHNIQASGIIHIPSKCVTRITRVEEIS
jgi:hypothetical protein